MRSTSSRTASSCTGRPGAAWTAASPFCHDGCPLGNLIPEWNDLVWRDDWRCGDPSGCTPPTTSRSSPGGCVPAPCEAACVLGISADPVTIKQVEVSIIDRAWGEGWVTPQPPDRQSGKTVAVVGSGPAGLAAAQQLTRAGHTVAVLERADAIGGLLRYGIPEFKMEKRHLDQRLAQMTRRGHDLPRRRRRRRRTSPARSCGRDYDAVVLAVRRHRVTRPAGARPRPDGGPAGDGVPAAGQPGGAATRRTTCRSSAQGKHVVIIGGGDTGADCLGTAHPAGCRVGDPAGDPAAAAGGTTRRQPVADLAADLPHVQRARGGRRAGVRREHHPVRGRGRRSGPRARAGGRRAGRRTVRAGRGQ